MKEITQDGWISVEDKLPEDLENVLGVHVDAGGIDIVYYSYEDKKWQSCTDNDPFIVEVLITHWQPLPKPPIK